MSYRLSAFSDVRLDQAKLNLVIDEHERGRVPRFDTLWTYYRNPLQPVGVGRGASGRWYHQPQEQGLPARLRTAAAHPLPDDRAQRREVVIENDIAWRIQAMVDFMFGKPVAIRSTAQQAKRTLIERVLDQVWEQSGGIALLQDIALMGHVFGHVDLVIRVDEDRLARAAAAPADADAALAAAAARFTNRVRRANYTQIFAATVEVTGTMQAVRRHGVSDELDYQKQERIRELLRDLENCVINGTAPAATPQGSAAVRRSLNGIVRQISTNQFVPGQSGFPAGGGAGTDLNETLINQALRTVWDQSSGRVDTIVVNGFQKRRINSFIGSTARTYSASDQRFMDGVGVYESDFGVCKVLLTRWCPADTILLLDSSRVEVLPLAGRSFHFKNLATIGDATAGQVVGEYTLEFRNENAHALIRGLSTS